MRVRATDAQLLADGIVLSDRPIGKGPLAVYPLMSGDKPHAVVIVFDDVRLGNVFQNKEGPPSYSFEVEHTDGLRALNQELCDMLQEGWVPDSFDWTPLVKREKYLTVKPSGTFNHLQETHSKGALTKGKSYKIAVRLASVWKHGKRAGASLKLVAAREAQPKCMIR